MRLSRRRVLRAGAGGGLAATAGCALPGRRGADTGTFLDWLPAPDALGVDGYRAKRLSAATYRRRRDALHPATRSLVESLYLRAVEPLVDLVGPATAHLVVGLDARVLLGVDVDGVATALVDAGYRRAGDHRGFAVYADGGGDLPDALAVGEDAVVAAEGGGPDGPREAVEAIVDARRGAAPRLHEAEEALGPAATDVDGTFVSAWPAGWQSRFGGLDATARGWSVGVERTRFREVMQFEDAVDAEHADVAGWVDDSWLADYPRRSVSRSDATVTVEAAIPTGRFDLTYPGDPGADGIPYATFDFAVDGLEVTVTHAGGQPLDARRLRISLDGRRARKQFRFDRDVVREGDSVTVFAHRAGVVEVVWRHPDANLLVPLGVAEL